MKSIKVNSSKIDTFLNRHIIIILKFLRSYFNIIDGIKFKVMIYSFGFNIKFLFNLDQAEDQLKKREKILL